MDWLFEAFYPLINRCTYLSVKNMDEQELQAIFEKLRNGVELTNEEMTKLSQSAGNSSKALNAMNSTLASLGRGVVDVTKKMTSGAQGASAYNSAIGDAAGAVSKVAGQFGILGKGLGFLVQAIGGYVQAVNELSDNLYNSYTKLSKSGVTAADGMTGLKDAAVALGFGLDQVGIEKFTNFMAEASQDLALMSGSAADGRKQLARFGGMLADRGPVQRAFGNLGYQIEDLANLSAGYIQAEIAMGRGRMRTDAELAAGTKNYIMLLDTQAKLTGTSVKALQDRMDADMRNQRFQATLLKVSREQGPEAAKRLSVRMADLSKRFGPLAEGIKDTIGGFYDTKAGAQAVISGFDRVGQLMMREDFSYLTEFGRIAKNNVDAFGEMYGSVSVYDDLLGPLYDTTRAAALSTKNFNDIIKDVTADQKRSLAGDLDPVTAAATNLRIEQMKTRDTMQGLLTVGVLPVTNAMANLAQIMNGLLAPFNAVARMFGYKPPGAPVASATEQVATGAFGGAATGAAIGSMAGPVGTVVGAGMGAIAGGVMGYAGSQQPKTMTQKDLEAMGLKIKQGDVQAEGSVIHPKTLQLAQAVQSSIQGFNYFSGFNDKYHQEKSPSSTHTSGKAFDFTVGFVPTAEQGKAIADQLRAMGAVNVIDEYNNPSSKSTGGHFHVQSLARGGIATGPKSGYMAQLHGNEAVVPLPDNRSIPVDMPNFAGSFDRQIDMMGQQIGRLDELVNLIRNQNSISTQILQVQSN